MTESKRIKMVLTGAIIAPGLYYITAYLSLMPVNAKTPFRFMCLGILGYAAIEDIKYKKVSFFTWIIILITGIIYTFIFNYGELLSVAFNIIGFGTFLIAIFALFKESIGIGDILILLSLSFCFGVNQIISALLLACFLIAIIGGVMTILKKINIKDKVPMIPFIYISVIVIRLINLYS